VDSEIRKQLDEEEKQEDSEGQSGGYPSCHGRTGADVMPFENSFFLQKCKNWQSFYLVLLFSRKKA
jgi:hypothetical protein